MRKSAPLFCALLLVALRKESVDRNTVSRKYPAILGRVALRKESVDRNSKISEKVLTSMSRSPQGERG